MLNVGFSKSTMDLHVPIMSGLWNQSFGFGLSMGGGEVFGISFDLRAFRLGVVGLVLRCPFVV